MKSVSHSAANGDEVPLTAWQSIVVPAGTVHRTREVGRAVNLTFEKRGAETLFIEPQMNLTFKARLRHGPFSRPSLIRRVFMSRTVLLITLFLAAASAVAQQPTGVAARMVTIKPKDGMRHQFEEGYKRHLDWHRQNKDTWTWYGWQVITGERFGHFVDGTFGHNWDDFDRAVAPAADAADNAENVVPYGDFLSVAQYVLLPEFSRNRSLEDGTPSPFIELVYYHLFPGKESEFERIVRATHGAYGKTKQPRTYAWYKLVSGGDHPTYMLLLPYNKASDSQSSEKSFTAVLEEAYPPRESRKLLRQLRDTVRDIRSENLRYRVDMSYFPPKN